MTNQRFIRQGHVSVDPVLAEEGGDPGIEFADESAFDLRRLLALVRANIILIAILVSFILGLALVITMLQAPRYTATATVQINDQSAQVLGKDQDVAQSEVVSPLDTERFLQTQMDILSSRAIAERVAKRLRLVGNEDFYKAMGKRSPSSTISRVRLKDMTLDLLQKNLEADLPRNSRLASISFTSIDSDLAARIANTWADEFIQANLQRRYDSSAYARDFVSDQLVETKAKLEQSERDLNAYARKAGLIRMRDGAAPVSDSGSATADSGNSITTSSLLQVNGAANQAEANRIALQQRWESVSRGDLLNAPEVLSNPTVASLLSERAKADASLQSERAKHLDDHPAVRQLQAQRDTINRQLNAVAQNIRAAVKQQYDSALASEKDLRSRVGKLMGSTMAEQDRTVQYNLLAREADTNRSLYDGLLQRYKELNAAAGISASNIAVIDPADAPTDPSSPNLARNLAVALFVGFVVSAVVIFIRLQFDDAVRVPEDIENKLGAPLLGVIPKVHGQVAPLSLLADPKSPISEAYNSLRTSLMYSTVGGLPKLLLVTSSQPSEGKSTSCFAIAQGIARLGRKVVLVDVDLRRPSVHTVIGGDNAYGMSSLLTSFDPVDNALRSTDTPDLSVITSGPIPPSPTELLSSGRMQQLLEDLRERFDLVIIDSPPVLGLADAPLLSTFVDGVVVIVQSDRSRRGSLKTSLRRLRVLRPRILGMVLTMFDAEKTGNRYSEYYGYNYYQYASTSDD